MDVGYARISKQDQNIDMQLDALTLAGCSKIYQDKGVSGAKATRPGLEQALDQLREGDVLHVWRLDRLGRSTRHVLSLLEELECRGVAFRSLSESFDTRGAMGRLMITIFAAFAQMERELIIDRTNAGLAAARARGRTGGRKPLLSDKQHKAVRAAYEAKDMSVAAIAEAFRVSTPTVWRSLARTRPVEPSTELLAEGAA